MRDGLPKGLPVPKKWQAFIACADRPADQGTIRVVNKLREAIHDEFPTDRRKALVEFAARIEGSLPGFEAAGVGELRGLKEPGHTYQLSTILNEFQSCVAKGEVASLAIQHAVVAGLEGAVAARVRQITEFLAGKVSVAELRSLTTEINRAVGSIDFDAEASRFLRESPPTAPKIEPDDDLRS